MAVKSFATNYLVADHDMYKEFMNKRFEYMKKNNLETDILFCNFGRGESFLPSGKSTVEDQNSYAAICKWHCITMSYSIWCDLVSHYVKEDNRVTNYKKFVNVPVDVLKKFKYRVEKSIENAKCDYNKRMNGGHGGSLNACRYLVMFWTYLDLKKDCKTQRYFPDLETIQRAAKIFGYAAKENPFEMNGKFIKRAERKVSEEKPMEQTEQNVDIRSIEIEDLELSMGTYNALKLVRINTLGDILDKTYDYLSKVRNMGLHSLREIEKKLNEYGYGFSGDGVIRPNVVPVQVTNYITNDTPLVNIISAKGLTNPLKRAGINTVGEFRSKSDKELLKIRTFGKTKLKAVKQYLDKLAPEESVIDIAEQAAKEVEEERKGLDISVHKFKGDPYLHVDVDNRKRINELNEKLEKAKNDYNTLLKKYNNLKDDYDRLDATRDALLRNKHDLESDNSNFIKEIENLKNNIAELRSRETKLNIAANPKNLDTLALLNTVLEKMKESKMEYILLTIDGMVIDIHPKQNVTIRTREAGYGRV